MIDVRGNDGAAAGDFVAHEFGSDVFRNRGAEGLASVLVEERVSRSAGILPALFFVAIAAKDGRAPFTSQILANRDELHLGRDDALLRVMHLRYAAAWFGAQGRAAQCRKIL